MLKRIVWMVFFVAVVMVPPVLAEDLNVEAFQVKTTKDLIALCDTSPDEPLYAAAVHFCHGYLVGAYHYHEASIAGPNAEGVYATGPMDVSQFAENQQARAAYTEKYGKEPGTFFDQLHEEPGMPGCHDLTILEDSLSVLTESLQHPVPSLGPVADLRRHQRLVDQAVEDVQCVELGSGDRFGTSLAVGDHVVMTPVPPCGTCYFCVRGEATLCANNTSLASFALPDGNTGLSQNGEVVYRGLGVGALHPGRASRL